MKTYEENRFKIWYNLKFKNLKLMEHWTNLYHETKTEILRAKEIQRNKVTTQVNTDNEALNFAIQN